MVANVFTFAGPAKSKHNRVIPSSAVCNGSHFNAYVLIISWALCVLLVGIRGDICFKSRNTYRKEGNVLFNDALNTFYFTVI